ncbi:MAG: peptide/nickel transport system permease protein [Kosmotogales bacterium]|nr:peptide/nickel transport system permease protein [Kosmotogales bacterium]
MKLSNIKDSIKNFWKEFRQVKSGIIGLILFLIFLFAVVFEPLIISFKETNNVWRDITYWEDLPRNVPPAWTNLFTSRKSAESMEIDDPEITEQQNGNLRILTSEFTYDYQSYNPPQDIIFRADGTGSPMIIIEIVRPDDEKITLFQKPVNLGSGNDVRVSMDSNSKDAVYNFLSKKVPRSELQKINKNLLAPTDYLFSVASEDFIKNREPLNGIYKIKVTSIMQNEDANISDPYIVLPGSVYGLLGTDSYKRDLWSGVVAGVKWALLIGLLTAVVSVSIGVLYGVISAYLGGWKDSLMMRIFEVFVSTPLLPVLIVLAAVFKPSIWTLIFMMCAFFWTGSVKTVRSMALQIKEETFIEASKAAGASNLRIIFKHMVPLLIPYSFASMALFIPGAIVYEASISLLGLGDATIVTWGQILSDAYNSGAILSGIWWWVVPPGLCIALMGMAFAFIGFAADKILHPKLRTR